MQQSWMYLWGHPVWSPVDRLDHVSAVASRVIGAAETAGTAKVYELDDPSWHEHHIVSLQVTVDHLV